ncbi:MAG: hypothetical protein ACRED2_06320, partial [Methylocella sp.]
MKIGKTFFLQTAGYSISGQYGHFYLARNSVGRRRQVPARIQFAMSARNLTGAFGGKMHIAMIGSGYVGLVSG